MWDKYWICLSGSEESVGLKTEVDEMNILTQILSHFSFCCRVSLCQGPPTESSLPVQQKDD